MSERAKPRRTGVSFLRRGGTAFLACSLAVLSAGSFSAWASGPEDAIQSARAPQALLLDVARAGGRIVGGHENTVFIAATYPDGSPASCEIKCVVVGPGIDDRVRPNHRIVTDDRDKFSVRRSTW